jgi:hypothetical protein
LEEKEEKKETTPEIYFRTNLTYGLTIYQRVRKMSSNWELTIQTNNIILIILALASLTRSKYLQIRTLTMGQFRKVVSTLLFACFGIGTALHSRTRCISRIERSAACP